MTAPIFLQLTSAWAPGVCVGMPLLVVALLVIFSLLHFVRVGLGWLLDKWS